MEQPNLNVVTENKSGSLGNECHNNKLDKKNVFPHHYLPFPEAVIKLMVNFTLNGTLELKKIVIDDKNRTKNSGLQILYLVNY